LREFFKSEGVWHFVDPQEPSILKAYDPNRPHFVPENAVWNKPKPNVEEELMEFEHEILHDLEAKKAQNLELVELNLNPWLTHPELTTIYQGLLAGNPIPARNVALPTLTPRRRRSRREATPVLVPTRLRSGKIIQPETFSDDEDEPLNLPVPEVPAAHPLGQLQEPLHIDPTTIEGFIPEHMRVSGNSIEVRAKYVKQRLTDGNPIPRIPDPGSSFSVFQEQEKRNEVQNDYNNELSKAHKEIRDYHTKLERILDKWVKDQESHDEKIAKVFKVYSTHLGEALLADLRESLTANHFRSAWIMLESRSKSVEISGENQKVLVKQLQSLKWKKGMQLSNLFERFNDLIELCSFDKPQHQMTFFHEMFSECNIKRYQDALLNQTNLNQNLDDLKARLLSEEAIVRLNDPPAFHKSERMYPNKLLSHDKVQKNVHLNAVKADHSDSRPTCEHCGKKGHSVDRCWLKNPDSRPTKKFKVNNVSSSSSAVPNKDKVIKDAHNLVKSAMSNKSKT
jgi:hypothetical protein